MYILLDILLQLRDLSPIVKNVKNLALEIQFCLYFLLSKVPVFNGSEWHSEVTTNK